MFNAEKSNAKTILPNRPFLPFNRRLSFTRIRLKCSKLAVDEFKIHQRQPAGETKSFRRWATIPQPPRIVHGVHPRATPAAQDMAGNCRAAPHRERLRYYVSGLAPVLPALPETSGAVSLGKRSGSTGGTAASRNTG